MSAIRVRVLSFIVLIAAFPPLAVAETANQARFLEAIDRMMAALAPESARASEIIRETYRDHLDLLVLDELAEIESALANGGLVPLPPQPLRFNLRPRVDGQLPIGEKDLAHQASYMSARPETIGCLLEVASRVTSGSLEITSLVRHSEYQDALRATNVNATTTLPMHTMGLAFDIALVNTPLRTVYAIRNVLGQMQNAGEILFIGERRQLVFHVVPHPTRLGHFMEVYAKALAAPLTRGADVIASSPVVDVLSPSPVPMVSAAVISVGPTNEYATEWWAADDARSDLTVQVTADSLSSSLLPSAIETPSSVGRLATRCLELVAGLLQSALAIVA